MTSGLSIVVRPAVPADYSAIARLTVTAYKADGQIQGTAVGYAETLADVAGRAAAGDLLVAVDGADVLGAVLLVRPGSRYAEVSRPRGGVPDARRRPGGTGARDRPDPRPGVHRPGPSRLVHCRRHLRARLLAAGPEAVRHTRLVRTPALDWSPPPDVHLLALRLELTADVA